MGEENKQDALRSRKVLMPLNSPREFGAVETCPLRKLRREKQENGACVCVGLRRPEELQKMQPSFKLNESAIEFGKKKEFATRPSPVVDAGLWPWEMRSRDKGSRRLDDRIK